jgi:hypothetical protein
MKADHRAILPFLRATAKLANVRSPTGRAVDRSDRLPIPCDYASFADPRREPFVSRALGLSSFIYHTFDAKGDPCGAAPDFGDIGFTRRCSSRY